MVEEPVDRVPESVTEAAATVPFLPLTPEITTVSPGYTLAFDTGSLFVIVVTFERVTFTVLPEVSST